MIKSFIKVFIVSLLISYSVKPVTIINGVHKEIYAIATYSNSSVQKGLRIRPGEEGEFEEIYVGMFDVSDRIVPDTIYFYWSFRDVRYSDYRLLTGLTNYLHKIDVTNSAEKVTILGLGNILITGMFH